MSRRATGAGHTCGELRGSRQFARHPQRLGCRPAHHGGIYFVTPPPTVAASRKWCSAEVAGGTARPRRPLRDGSGDRAPRERQSRSPDRRDRDRHRARPQLSASVRAVRILTGSTRRSRRGSSTASRPPTRRCREPRASRAIAAMATHSTVADSWRSRRRSDQGDSGGRARLPRAEPRASRRVLRLAAVAADLQAAPHGLGARSLARVARCFLTRTCRADRQPSSQLDSD